MITREGYYLHHLMMTESTLGTLVMFGLIGLVSVTIARQCRKPTWLVGRLFARMMNSSHLSVTMWGLTHVPFEPHFTVLDAGCGGGRTIQQLLALAPHGKIYGIDYSEASVAVAKRLNASAITAGIADIRLAPISTLPFPPETFDVVTAVETHYYWPSLKSALEEVRRVLKPGGRFAIIAESYVGKRLDVVDRFVMRLLGGMLLTPTQHREALIAAGFTDVEVVEDRRQGWICAMGRRDVDTIAWRVQK